MKRKEKEDRQTAMTPEELLMGDSEEVSKGGFMGESEGVSKGVLMGESEERGGFKGSKGGLMAESEERGSKMSFEVIKWVDNKTFVKIMKNTVHFRNFENF